MIKYMPSASVLCEICNKNLSQYCYITDYVKIPICGGYGCRENETDSLYNYILKRKKK